nr:MAG TPA: hypothetical protein [Caudoviricetes sp.]
MSMIAYAFYLYNRSKKFLYLFYFLKRQTQQINWIICR